MDPKGKVVLITGGAVRIGRAIALVLSKAGCRLLIHYRHSEKNAKELKKKIERRYKNTVVLLQADLNSLEGVKALTDQATSQGKRVDILINNAAEFYRTPIGKISEKNWDQLLSVNLKAPFFLSQWLGRQMVRNKAGKIINIADISAFRPWKDYLPYSISKAGLVTLTQGLAKAFAPYVQVNAVAPGTILAPVTGWNAQQRRQTLDLIPLRRMGSPQDIARTVLFLIENDYMTGTVIPIDGGRQIV